MITMKKIGYPLIALYIGLFSWEVEEMKLMNETSNLIALYIGLFSKKIKKEDKIMSKKTYCPLYRAVLQLYLPQFYIRISHELPFFNRKSPKKWDNHFD